MQFISRRRKNRNAKNEDKDNKYLNTQKVKRMLIRQYKTCAKFQGKLLCQSDKTAVNNSLW